MTVRLISDSCVASRSMEPPSQNGTVRTGGTVRVFEPHLAVCKGHESLFAGFPSNGEEVRQVANNAGQAFISERRSRPAWSAAEPTRPRDLPAGGAWR